MTLLFDKFLQLGLLMKELVREIGENLGKLTKKGDIFSAQSIFQQRNLRPKQA